MGHHYTRSTVSVSAYCKKCNKQTQHRVDDHRRGPCLDCIARLEKQFAVRPKPAEKQRGLFAS